MLRDASGAELNELSYSVAGQANLSRSLERDAELQISMPGCNVWSNGRFIAISINMASAAFEMSRLC